MNKNLPIGTAVVLTEVSNLPVYNDAGFKLKKTERRTSKRYGKVCEIGTGLNEGRLRIKWEYCEVVETGYHATDTKRTWIKSDRLAVVPTPINGSEHLPAVDCF